MASDAAQGFYGPQMKQFAGVLDGAGVPMAIIPTALGHSWEAARTLVPTISSSSRAGWSAWASSRPPAEGRERARCYPEVPELAFRVLEARPGSDCTMARTKFVTPEALIVISTDGYFDVFPLGARVPNARPAYRGTVDLLDRDVRAGDRSSSGPIPSPCGWPSPLGPRSTAPPRSAGRWGQAATASRSSRRPEPDRGG